jgi:hypothetical protein
MRCDALPDSRSGYIFKPNFRNSPSISTFRWRRGGAEPFHISDFFDRVIYGLASAAAPTSTRTRTHVDL